MFSVGEQIDMLKLYCANNKGQALDKQAWMCPWLLMGHLHVYGILQICTSPQGVEMNAKRRCDSWKRDSKVKPSIHGLSNGHVLSRFAF